MSLFDRFRKNLDFAPQVKLAPAPEKVVAGKPYDKDNSIRRDVSALYDHGVNPVRAIMAMLHETDGTLATDAEKLSGVWLGINDLLDRDGIEADLRTQLVGIRNGLGKAISDTGPGPRTFISNYRENTRRINEMKFLQSYKPKIIDANGVMQFEAVCKMLSEIEQERANNPGSMAQDISDEKLASLYSLRDNWDEPGKF